MYGWTSVTSHEFKQSEPSRFESVVVVPDPSARDPGLLSLEKAEGPRDSVHRELHVSPCVLHQGSGVAFDLVVPSHHLFGDASPTLELISDRGEQLVRALLPVYCSELI